jgi:chorismate mutase
MSEAPLRLVGLRGATTCTANTTTDIRQAVRELIDALVSRNGISPEQIVSVTFSVTADLDACFPAAEARQRTGWDSVALLDCQ